MDTSDLALLLLVVSIALAIPASVPVAVTAGRGVPRRCRWCTWVLGWAIGTAVFLVALWLGNRFLAAVIGSGGEVIALLLSYIVIWIPLWRLRKRRRARQRVSDS